MKKLLLVLLMCPLLVFAEEGGNYDAAPDLSNNQVALQRGAKLFVNYCLNCHAAASMRYNRLRDLGLSEAEIKANLLFATDKVGDLMKVALQPKDAKAWLGVAPPDLSVIASAKGSDYIYTYLRTYYRDPSRPTGWNNVVYPGTAMPHILWQLQGTQDAVFEERKAADGEVTKEFVKFEQVTAGQMNKTDYDSAAADLTGFLTYMADPSHNSRVRLGVWVLLFLAVFSVITWRLNAAFWKDIK
jgi:ubiquinol-cytochrome c reductase cytochrome c1 subunit